MSKRKITNKITDFFSKKAKKFEGMNINEFTKLKVPLRYFK